MLEVDPTKRRISLGLKQTQDNPWDAFLAQHPKGTIVEGPIRNITEFGLFIGLDNGIDGMVHLSRTSTGRSPATSSSRNTRRATRLRPWCSMSIAPRSASRSASNSLPETPPTRSPVTKKGDTVTCEVVAVQENGIEVKIADSDITTFVKRSDLSRDRSEQRPERFTVGQKVDAAVLTGR